jgi:hypothetical protein
MHLTAELSKTADYYKALTAKIGFGSRAAGDPLPGAGKPKNDAAQ